MSSRARSRSQTRPQMRGGKEKTDRGFTRRRATKSQSSHRGLRVVFMSLLMLGMGQSLFFAVLPPIARDIGLSESETGVIFSLSAALWVFCSPFWGRRSDVWGRRTVMVIGLSGFAASTTLIALTVYAGQQGWLPGLLILPALIVSRAIFGMFGSGTMPAAQAYIADRTTRKRRAKGAAALTASFGIGNIIGPGFAAGLVVFGFLTPFVLVGMFGFFAAAMILILLPEGYRKRFGGQSAERLGLFSPRIRVFMVMGILISYAQAALVQLSAFYFIDRLELAAPDATQVIGVALTVMALAALFAQFVLIQRFELSVQDILRYGSIVMVISLVGMALSENYGLLVIFLGLAGLGFGLLRPGLMAAGSLAVGRKYQGSVAGTMNATAAVGHMINPFTGAVLYQYYPPGPFWIAAACMACLLLITLYHPKIRALGEKGIHEDDTPAVPAPLAVHVAHTSDESPARKSSKRSAKKKN